MSESQRRYRRRVLRPTLVLAALAALSIVLVPTGSAGTTSKPFAANFGSTVLPAANAPAAGAAGDGSVSFAITDETKNQQLGSANVYAPAGVTITGTDASASNLDPSQTFPATTLKLRNLNLDPPTTSATYGTTIYVSAPCGSFTWSIDAHQSNDYNSSSGNSLFLDGPKSSLNTLDAGSCHLAWIHQPASAITSTPITDTPFSAGNSVAVAVEDASNTPINLNTGTATLAVNGSFDCGASCGSFTGTTSTTFSQGVATFPTFQSAFPGTGFTATASAFGLTSQASSPPFVIEPSGANCIGKDPCVINGPAGNGQVGISGSGGNFIYMAFSSSTLPASVTGPGGGCASFTGTHTDFAETDARSGDGTLTVTLSIKNNDLKQAYGPNYGQPNVPICVGVKFLSGNTPVSCDPTNPDTGFPWADRLLNSTHVFGGQYGTAVCDNIPGDAGFGYWWGVAGTYQDPNPPFDASSIPLVTSWGGTGTSPSSTRTFVLSVPSDWDMQGHG